MSEENENEGLIIDFDSYFTSFMHEPNELKEALVKGEFIRLIYEKDPELRELEDLYYLLIRSQYVPMLNNTRILHESGALKVFREKALQLTARHLMRGAPEKPHWLEQILPSLQALVKQDYPNIDDIEVDVVMDTRLHARAISNNKIIISGALREFLRHYNLVVWTILDMYGPSNLGESTHLLTRATLPSFLYSNDVVPSGNIPIFETTRKELFFTIQQTSRLQTMFIIAHEYAHICLGHLGKRGLSKEEKIKLEIEADQYAIELLVRHSEGSELDFSGDLWIALRWLVQYYLIDEVISRLLSGSFNSLEELSFDARKNEIIKTFFGYDLGMERNDNLFEYYGSLLLMSMKASLIHNGQKKLTSILEEITSPNTSGRPVSYSWWTDYEIVGAKTNI
ncbi:MAG: ImmA/IrrE family metallo-endopeptidase [Candidatus Thiodiazotropha endolucinida]|nr:ImmA/IrrE family metallo-endopeptidase [Candidatus Thiodiazotropha taylori]MCW4324200.1 ImmA/IrrE family metallo-endopeptidase [Candidatus Thiodiazotropha taylori]